MGRYNFRFVDLFAGIGGFHQAMRYLGGTCVMASEINAACIETYKANFKKCDIRGDITQIDPNDIPPFEVLCAGFPCQPFSKAGLQQGFNDESRGNLFYTIMNILDAHPEIKFVILENVRNLADKTENWEIIRNELMRRNFYITEEPIILSPSNFGIPQVRERVYILGINKDIRDKEILTNGFIHIRDMHLEGIQGVNKCKMGAARKILSDDVDDQYIVSSEEELMINAWEVFRRVTKITVIGFPIWISCFGVGLDDEANRIRLGYDTMPQWKKRFVDNNRKLYLNNQKFIDKWIARYDMLNRIKLYQKFEWNCGKDCNSIREALIQIRQSGIRAKRPTYYPSLVAMVNTPIVWDQGKKHFRYITTREAAKLQSFHGRYKFIGTDSQIYKQLGNSVNVRILKVLGENLFNLAKKGWDHGEGN